MRSCCLTYVVSLSQINSKKFTTDLNILSPNLLSSNHGESLQSQWLSLSRGLVLLFSNSLIKVMINDLMGCLMVYPQRGVEIVGPWDGRLVFLHQFRPHSPHPNTLTFLSVSYTGIWETLDCSRAYCLLIDKSFFKSNICKFY